MNSFPLKEYETIPNLEEYIKFFLNFIKKNKERQDEYGLTHNKFRLLANCFFNHIKITVRISNSGNASILLPLKMGENGKLEELRMDFNISGKAWCEKLVCAEYLFTYLLLYAHKNWLSLKKGDKVIYDKPITVFYDKILSDIFQDNKELRLVDRLEDLTQIIKK